MNQPENIEFTEHPGYTDFSPAQLAENPQVVREIRQLAGRAEGVDGVAALSEQYLAGLDDARLGHRHTIAYQAGAVVGVVAIADACGERVAELVVDPQWRRRGIGSELAARIGARGQVWAHGNLSAARELARQLKAEVTRRLLVMDIDDEALRQAAAAEEDTGLLTLDYVDSVARFGRDYVESSWLTVNNEAFAWHPEQGGWDLDRLHRGMESEWFDGRDLLFLWDEHDERPAVLAGFHWTKWHDNRGEGEPGAANGEGFGEVYVVGLADAYRGRRLGGPLLAAGLARQVDNGANKVILYVEADNAPAVSAYGRLGFTVREEHVVYTFGD